MASNAERSLSIDGALGEDTGDELARGGTAVKVPGLGLAGNVLVVTDADVLVDNAVTREVAGRLLVAQYKQSANSMAITGSEHADTEPTHQP